jgi:hypothetical protein
MSPSIESALRANEELESARARRAEVKRQKLVVEMTDGRVLSVPLRWYPRLMHATPNELKRVEISNAGLHWRELDEDLSIRGLLLGRRSGEGRGSFKFWLNNRKRGRNVTLEDYVAHLRQKRKSKAK